MIFRKSLRRCQGYGMVLPAFFGVASVALAGAGLDAQRIVARRMIAVLPGELSGFFDPAADDMEERTLEPDLAWEREHEHRNRQNWHHLGLDARAKNGSTSARLGAAEAFPRSEPEARKLFKSLGLARDGGRLPWAVQDLYADLVTAFQTGDREAILASAGYLTHFCWDASQPFRATTNHDGKQTGNLCFGEAAVGTPGYPHQSVQQRIMGELVRRNRNRYRDSVRVQPIDVKPASDPLEAAFGQQVSSLARLDDLLEADRAILTQLGVKDGESFSKREDEYYQLMDARCGDVVVERMQAAALLSANLLAGAWERAGRPVLAAAGPAPTAASPPGAPAADAPASPKDRSKPSAPTEGESLVGSDKSPVFHRSSCEHAKKIGAGNLVRYATAKEAQDQGKRGCRVCKPE